MLLWSEQRWNGRSDNILQEKEHITTGKTATELKKEKGRDTFGQSVGKLILGIDRRTRYTIAEERTDEISCVTAARRSSLDGYGSGPMVYFLLHGWWIRSRRILSEYWLESNGIH